MRPVHLISFLAISLATAGLTARAAGPVWATLKVERPVANERTSFSKTISEVGVDPETSETVALSQAREAVIKFLREQEPPLNVTPTTAEVTEKYIRDKSTEELQDEQSRKLGLRYRTTLKVEVSSRQFREILRADHQHVVEQRHWLVAKGLGGLVLVLATLAIYFRLDEWTKGYYTMWLRMGAAMVLSGVAGGLFLLP